MSDSNNNINHSWCYSKLSPQFQVCIFVYKLTIISIKIIKHFCFYKDVHPVQDLRPTQGSGLQEQETEFMRIYVEDNG